MTSFVCFQFALDWYWPHLTRHCNCNQLFYLIQMTSLEQSQGVRKHLRNLSLFPETAILINKELPTNQPLPVNRDFRFDIDSKNNFCHKVQTFKNNTCNKKVLLRERKRHTARRAASACYAALSRGVPHPRVGGVPQARSWWGYPIPGQGGTPSQGGGGTQSCLDGGGIPQPGLDVGGYLGTPYPDLARVGGTPVPPIVKTWWGIP